MVQPLVEEYDVARIGLDSTGGNLRPLDAVWAGIATRVGVLEREERFVQRIPVGTGDDPQRAGFPVLGIQEQHDLGPHIVEMTERLVAVEMPGVVGQLRVDPYMTSEPIQMQSPPSSSCMDR